MEEKFITARVKDIMILQETIIAQLDVKPSIDPKEEIRKSVDF